MRELGDLNDEIIMCLVQRPGAWVRRPLETPLDQEDCPDLRANIPLVLSMKYLLTLWVLLANKLVSLTEFCFSSMVSTGCLLLQNKNSWKTGHIYSSLLCIPSSSLACNQLSTGCQQQISLSVPRYKIGLERFYPVLIHRGAQSGAAWFFPGGSDDIQHGRE